MSTATTTVDGTYNADPIHSSFQASVRHMGVGTFKTTFSDVTATLTTDGGPRLEGRAQVESIAINNPPQFREHVLGGDDLLDAANHPEITFSSSRLDLRDDGTVELDGELVIKGIAKPITATGTWQEPVEDPYGSLRTAVDVKTVVDRRDYGITWQAALPKGGDALGWDVTIEAHLELVKAAE